VRPEVLAEARGGALGPGIAALRGGVSLVGGDHRGDHLGVHAGVVVAGEAGALSHPLGTLSVRSVNWMFDGVNIG
jgi:hypothetical protein